MPTAAPALLALDHVCLAVGEVGATCAGRLLLGKLGWDGAPYTKFPLDWEIVSLNLVYQNYL